MKKLFLLGVFFGLSLTLRARDSLWLLGQGTAIVTDKGEDGKPFDSRHGIAISLFDVRFKGDQRRDAVLLMMGERRLEGTVFNLFNVIDAENAMTKVIELKEAKASMFKGKIQVQLRGGKRSIVS